MKIEKVECFALRHHLSTPRGPSILEYSTRETLLIKITDSDGLAGWGETYLAPGTPQVILSMAPLLVGKDASRARQLWTAIWQASNDGYAVGGVSLALDDLRARQAGLPLHGLYGWAVRDRVRAYASSGGYCAGVDPARTWPDEVSELVERGFTGVKLRIGRFDPAHELPLLARLRAETPAEVDLMADGNAAYTFSTAVHVGKALGELGFAWFEEPMPQHQGYVGYERLAARLDIALAGGEIVENRGEAHDLLRRTAVDIIQPDVCICGGIGEALFIADLARIYGVRCVPHAWAGGVALAATIQALALLPDPTRSPSTPAPLLEYDVAENPFRDEVLQEPIRLEDGWVDVPNGPGLGVEVDEEYVRRRAEAV